MSVALRQPLTLEECQQVRLWRNDPDVLPTLRNKEPLTEEQQESFYREVICEPEHESRYYAVEIDGQFVGMGGLTHITDGRAEIALIVNPYVRGLRVGEKAVDALLAEAFGALGLDSVVGECYENGATGFWAKQIQRFPARMSWEWLRA